MMDLAYEETMFMLDSMEYQINRVYRQAEKELEEKVNKFYKDFARLDTQRLKEVADGKITQAEYDQWRRNKIFNGKVWEQRKDVITKDLHSAHDLAQSVVYGYLPDVYAINHNFATYKIEQDARIDTSYTLYSHETVERLLSDNPELIPYRKLNEEKFNSWTKKNIQAAMLQGVLQGESIPRIAKRLAKTVSEKDRKCAIRDARTMTTGAMNGGKYDALKRVQKMGVNVRARWRATFDDRTRDSHRALDGEIVDIGQPFSNGLLFPVDLHELESGQQISVQRFGIICRETYNCRCAVQGVYKGLEPRAIKYRSDAAVGIPYEEWKKGHKAANEYRIAHGKNPHTRKGVEIVPKTPKIQPKAKTEPIKSIVHSDEYIKIEERIKNFGNIAAKEVQKLSRKLSDNEIIKRICGGDKTKGSCSSLTYAYISNKMGYDVLDFRDGDSRQWFSMQGNIDAVDMLKGIARQTYAVKIESTGVAKKLKELNLPYGKEYKLTCGKHASIIRNTENGYEYLELQSAKKNGWKSFTKKEVVDFKKDANGRYIIEDGHYIREIKEIDCPMSETLHNRFGCRKTRTKLLGMTFDSRMELTEVDSYANVQNDDFIGLMKYINTDEALQKKGISGHER